MELKCSQVGHNPSFERHTECSRISRSARRRLSRKSRKTCKSHAQFSNSQYGSNSDLGPIRQQGPIQPAIWTDRSQSMQNLTSPFTENTNGSGRGNFRSSGQSEQRNNDAGQQSDQQAFTRSRQVSNQEARSRFNIPITGLSSQGGTQAPKGYDDMNSSDWQDSGSALQGDSKTTWRGFWNGKGPEPKKRFKARSLWGRNFSKDKATPKQTPEDDWAGVEQQVPEDDDGWGTSPDAKIQAKSQQKSDEKQIKGKIANSNAINEFQDTPASREPLEAAVQDEFRSSTARFRGDTEARESLTGVDDKVSQEDQPNIPGKKSERNWYVVSDQPSRGKSAQGSEPRESSQNESQNVPVNGNFSPFVSEQTVNGRAESRIGELEPEIMEDAESGWDEIEEDWQDGTGPDITLLSPSEADELLPVVPTAEQMGYAWGNAVDLWQRLGSAAFVTIITVKLNLILIASGAASYPFWGPLLTAANRNRAIRSTGRHVGFWRTRVLEMNVERPQRRRYTGQTSSPVAITRPTIRFLLGDDSGARSSLSLPLNKRYESIQIGEPAEAIVLSSKSGFSTFKALREVYFPESGLWMSEYPHVNRNLFLDISLDIERARRQEMMEGTLDALV